MNLSDTVELIGALKSKGVSHFKSSDFEVRFGEYEISQPKVITETLPYVEPPQGYDPVETKKAEDLIDLLKLKDNELVDKIFPDGSI